MTDDFITTDELRSAIRAATSGRISEGDQTILRLCLSAAIDEVRSYLRTRYDVDKIFSARGDARSALVVEH